MWAAALAASGVVYSFGLLTGMELSTTRAVIMFLLMMTAGSIGVTYDTLTALGVSAILQLWENPFALWYAGLLFSYTAVLGAVVITRIVKQVTGGKKHKILDTVRTSLCIQMATIPVSLFFYYEVSPYSILANGCILPFMGMLLFLGALGGVVGIAHSGLAAMILTIPEWILKGCEWVCQFFVGLPGSSVITGKPSVEKIILYYVLLLLLLYRMKQTEHKKYLIIWMGVAFLLCCGNSSKGTEIDVLDVGQGDGIFLQSDKGGGVFIDGGSTDVGKVGTYRILPFLKCRGKQEISLWFVSHLDADHVNGLIEILESDYPVENIIFADGVVKDEAWQTLVQLAEEKESQISYLKAGEQITLDNMRFTVLYPWKEGTDRNQSSMVLFTQLDGMTGLFSGDIGEEQEQEMVKNEKVRCYLEKPITFYKAAHHGSNSSNSMEFLEVLSPEVTVVSCGENNSYGHPGKEAVERMEQVESKLYYTMENGQITLRKGDEGVWLWKFQN